MYWRITKSLGFEVMYEQMYIVPEYAELMRVKWGDGKKLIRLLIMMYDIFSEYNMDIRDEGERMEVCSKSLGINGRGILEKSEWIIARDAYKLGNTDVEVEQIKSVEKGILKMINERDILIGGKDLGKEDLERVEIITKILKTMFSEREELMAHFVELVRSGSLKGGKLVGNKKLSYLGRVNDEYRMSTKSVKQ